jgi:hypothetical protein
VSDRLPTASQSWSVPASSLHSSRETTACLGHDAFRATIAYLPRRPMLTARAAFLCLVFSVLASLVVAAAPIAPKSDTPPPKGPPDDLDRYVGTYEFQPGRVLRVYREGASLRAKADGQPEGTLLPDRKPGHFSLREAPISLEFVADAVGVVVGLELVLSTGQRQRLRRLPDTAAAAPLQQMVLARGTSVNARVFNGYTRTKDAEGKYKIETYVFGEGGFQDDAALRDKSIDNLSFERLLHSLTSSLARQNYLPPKNPQPLEEIDLLIMVYWGSTAGKHDPGVVAEETFDPLRHDARDRLNRINARVLGYENAAQSVLNGDWGGLVRTRGHDLVDEIEERRYWVALVALDFASAQRKQIKLLWSVRYNMASQGTNFTASLPQMTQFASNFFGRDSGGLISPSTRENEGKVEIGEATVVADETTSNPIPTAK